MDPREFLPVLESLQSKSPEYYRRFHIDLYVEDYLSALKNICQVDEKIDECIAHIKQHNLYSQALLIFQKSPNYTVVFYISFKHFKQ
uniref:Uncharacterized protein n=1 Tax=Panagrolaimus davidi TaxID=227884 RepID=A0A914P7M4_9BILA